MRKMLFALLLFSICLSAKGADGYDGLDVCEDALQILVSRLDADGKLSDANRIDKLPDFDVEYSTCVVPTDASNDRDDIAYFVFRHSNDVTIFVHKVPVPPATIVLYGPFHSAYRK